MNNSEKINLANQLLENLHKFKRLNTEAQLCFEVLSPFLDAIKKGDDSIILLPCGYFFSEGSLSHNEELVDCYLQLALLLRFPQEQSLAFSGAYNNYD